MTSKSITEYDAKVTTKIFGYKTFDDYLEGTSPINDMEGIRTPVFILLAENDPIIGQRNIDRNFWKLNENVMVGMTRGGGHVAYYTDILT